MTKKRNNQKAPKIVVQRIDVKSKVYNDLADIDQAELEKPFELQHFGMPETHVNNMSLNQDDRVWLLRKDDMRDRILRADLVEYVDNVYNRTSNQLVKQLGEVLDAHWARTNEIIDNFRIDNKHTHDKLFERIDDIAGDITSINSRLLTVENRLKEGDEKFKELEIIHEIPRSVDERLKKIEAYKEWTEAVDNYMSPKWTAVRIAAAVIFGSMLSLLLHSYFADSLHKFIQYLKP